MFGKVPSVNIASLALTAFATGLLAIPVHAEGKPARCVIRNGPDRRTIAYSGGCLFYPDKGGTFTIRTSHGNILPSITDINVYVLSPGIAEVRGLTIKGINSRWGRAKRNDNDLACWTGSDFEVCAY